MNDTFSGFLKEHGRMIAIAIVIVLGVLGFFLLMKSFAAVRDLGEDYNYNTFTVVGKGTAEAPPTIAEIVFTVQETSASVATAQEAATTRTTAALDALQALDIANEDIRTSGYNVNPQYESQPCFGGFCNPGSPTINGYQVSQTVTVKVRNPDNAGPALQALGDAGVQNISGPNFMVDDDSEVMQEARGEAIEDANEQARVLAEQLGVKLGDVVSFTEGDGSMPYDVGYGGAMMDMASPMAREVGNPALPQGVNESEVTVSITYKFK